MLVKSVYNLYILYILNTDGKPDNIRDVLRSNNNYLGFQIISFITAMTYLLTSVYFISYNKVRGYIFGLFIIYMLWRALGYFTTMIAGDIPYLTEIQEKRYTNENMFVVSLITIMFTIYLIKLILG